MSTRTARNPTWRMSGILAPLIALAVACGSSSPQPLAPDAAPPSIDAMQPDTWNSFAAGFFDSYCGACHGAGDTIRDYSVLATVQAEQGKIRCGVANTALAGCSIAARQFPVGNGAMPSDAEREQLVQWIDSGSL